MKISQKDFQALVDQSKKRQDRMAASNHPSPKHGQLESTKEDRSNTTARHPAVADTTNASHPLAQKAMNALREDKKLADQDRDIKIHQENDRLVIQGSVESEQVKNHIMLVVKKVTDSEVVDEMTVR